MRVAHADTIEWAPLSGHRAGTIRFKRLLEGRPGDPGNFELSLARADGDYYTPRHRHNFDQIRVALEGRFNFATKRDLKERAVGYFPEGTAYGPQEARERSVILLLQFGGASGDGFMSYDQLASGYAALQRQGDFDSGVFRSGDSGRRVNRDGYEAIWEHVNGRSVQYPAARYEDPVVMHPDAYRWRDLGGGVQRKRLGVFSEAGTEVGLLQLQPGSASGFDGARLGFVLDGGVRVGDQSLARWSAVHAERGEALTLAASSPSEVFYVRLPDFA